MADYTPLFLFHPYETHLPCCIEHLLKGGWLKDARGNVLASDPTVETLMQYSSRDDVHVEVAASQFHGQELGAAPLYVVVATPPDQPSMLDLTFFVLFAYNGAQGARVRPAITPPLFDCLLPDYGKHQGDLESVTVRVTATEPRTIAWVRFAAHGHDRFLSTGDVMWSEGTHPVARCGLGAHGMYTVVDGEGFETSNDYTFALPLLARVGFELGDPVADNGTPWRARPEQLVAVGLDAAGMPVPGTAQWAGFRGRLGAPGQANEYTTPVGLDGRRLTTVQQTLVHALHTAASTLNLIPRDDTIGSGPVGLGTRPYARVKPAKPVWTMNLSHIGNHTTLGTPFVADGEIYFMGTDRSLWRVETQGTHGSQLLGPSSCGSDPFVDDGVVYFTGHQPSMWPPRKVPWGLWRVERDGARLRRLVPDRFLAHGTPFVYEGWVYFVEADHDNLVRVDTSGHNLHEIGRHRSYHSPWVLGDWVYFRGTDAMLRRCHPDGTGLTTLGTTQTTPCAAGDGWVYYVESRTKRLMRTMQDGSATPTQIRANHCKTMPRFADGVVYFQGLDEAVRWVTADGTAQGSVGANSCASPPFPLQGTVYFQGLDNGLNSCDLEA